MNALIAILARRPWMAAGAFVVLAVLLVFGGALFHPYAWDDGALVEESPLVAAPGGLGPSLVIAFQSDFWEHAALPYPSGMYRPVTIASYLLERAAFGPSALASHAVNLGLHLAVALLLLGLAARFGARPLGAALGTGLFALHPAVVMPVVNVTSRTDLLAALFLLLGLHATLRLRRSSLAALGAGAALLLALLSKETAVVGGAALGLVALLPDRTPGLPSRDRKARILLLAALAGATALYLLLRVNAHGGLVLPAPGYQEGAPLPLAFFGGPELTVRYALLSLLPFGLAVTYPLPLPTVLGGLAGLSILGGLALLLWRRRQKRALLALAWFVLALLPVTGWIGAPARFSQLYLYLPLLGVTALLATHLFGNRAVAVASVALGLLGMGAWQRVSVWESERTLWADAAKKNPGDASAHLNLGNALLAEGHPAKGRATLKTALSLAREAGSRGTAAKIALSLGNGSREAGELEAARVYFREAAKLSEDRLGAALINLSLASADAGELAEAEDAGRRAVQSAPGDARAHVALGVALARQARFAEARAPFEAALKLDPENADARRSLTLLEQIEQAPRPPTP